MTAGLDLAERFYRTEVRPLVDRHQPGLRHTACLVGSGSEVLGYDDDTSTDHDWGPRVQLLLPVADHRPLAHALDELFARLLPDRFEGWSVAIPTAAPAIGTAATPARSRSHGVTVSTVEGLLGGHLGAEVAQRVTGGEEPTVEQWLATPSQQLLAVTAGRVFHDDLGLARIRTSLTRYPADVWRYVMAGAWSQVGEDEHLAPRAGMTGDDVGSRVIAARVVRALMQLAVLQERRFPPYAKWLGRAAASTAVWPDLHPHLARATADESWTVRQEALVTAGEVLARVHNRLGLTPPAPDRGHAFHDRPFRVLGATRVARLLATSISDPAFARLLDVRVIGGIDQVTASTDVLADPEWVRRAGRLYEP